MQKKIIEVEHDKNEAVAAARLDVSFCMHLCTCALCIILYIFVQANTYKSDFLEECKDHERAQGALEDLKKKRGGQDIIYHEEATEFYQEINALKKECSDLITRDAKCKAKHEAEMKTLKEVTNHLKSEVEKLTRERDHSKEEVKTAKQTNKYLNEKMLKIAKERDSAKDTLKQEIDRRKKSKQKPHDYDKIKGPGTFFYPYMLCGLIMTITI